MSGGGFSGTAGQRGLLLQTRKYRSFFRIRFLNGLQYRAAALGGIVTQFAWGFMEIMVYSAFYHSSAPGQFPMEMQALSSYIWLQQAFLMLFAVWFIDGDIIDLITSGNMAYELCRPMNLYLMWFLREFAGRLSRAVLRCFPILLVAAFLPAPYGLVLPKSPGDFLLFLLSGALAALLTVSLGMLIYIGCFFTMSPMGVRTIFSALGEFLSGAIVPLPFLPDSLQKVVSMLPFASTQNVPLRIFGGDLAGNAAAQAIALQVFWVVVLLTVGVLLLRKAQTRAVVQGG